MNYRLDMEKSIKFIEENLDSELTAAMIANHIGYSLYHYSRVFLACYGTPIMEYVRKRRLSLAAHAISQGKKVIDVALEFGFETPSGFSKAFRREYNCTPTSYQKKGIFEPLNVTRQDDDGGTQKWLGQVRIEHREAFKVGGYSVSTQISNVASTKDLAAFWEQADMEGWEIHLYEKLNPRRHGELGIYIPKEKDEALYVLGVVVDNFKNVDLDMVAIEIPTGDYAVFTTRPVNMKECEADLALSIKNGWRAIFEDWFLRNREYQYDESRPDFEYYDERCHYRPDSVIEIWIPIKKTQGF